MGGATQLKLVGVVMLLKVKLIFLQHPNEVISSITIILYVTFNDPSFYIQLSMIGNNFTRNNGTTCISIISTKVGYVLQVKIYYLIH